MKGGNESWREKENNWPKSFSFRKLFVTLQRRTVNMKNKFEMQENGSLLGAAILRVRKAKGLTQEELAVIIGVLSCSGTYIIMISTSINLIIPSIKKIIKRFYIS